MLLSVLYVILIVAANIFASLWMVPLPFGVKAPAGVFFFAPLFTLRDRIQIDRGTRWVYMLIAITAVLSWLMGVFVGLPLLARISLASVAAFIVSESLDTLLFTVVKRSFVQRSLISNLFSSVADSAIFITLAFGWNPRIILGQWIIKMIISSVMIPLLKPKAVHAPGA
ncbi:MAG TPA: VUT family protein [bacterium]